MLAFRFISRWNGLLAVVLPLVSVAGCGRAEVGSVAGRVTLDGSPLSGAVILFENAERGVSVDAELAADGSYSVRLFDMPGLQSGK